MRAAHTGSAALQLDKARFGQRIPQHCLRQLALGATKAEQQLGAAVTLQWKV